MNETEHLLVCLSEECDEVGQRAAKALRFSLGEVQPGQGLTNAERIVEELHDLISVATILWMRGVIPDPLPSDVQVSTKADKIERFMALARSSGALQPKDRPDV